MTTGDTLPHSPSRLTQTLADPRPLRGWRLHPGVRSDGQLSLGERTADRARDVVGSWPFIFSAAGVWVGVGVVLAVRHDDRVGPVTMLGLILPGLLLMQVSLVLMAARRADRTAHEQALHDLEDARRTAAAVHELRGEVEQLHGEVSRLLARVETSRQRVERAPG